MLSDISLAVHPAEIVTILGPNGSGKSTLLRALLGILPLSSGQVTRAAGLRLGYVPQKLAIDRSMPMTVRRFLSLPTRVSNAEATAALARVGLPDLEKTPPDGSAVGRAVPARAAGPRPLGQTATPDP